MKATCPHCGNEIEVSFYTESDAHQIEKLGKYHGFVYLVYSPTNGIYKIGRAKSVDNRYGSIARQSPVEVRLIHTFESKNTKLAEKTLHKQFEHKRVLGEWFSLSENEVEKFISIGDFEL